MKSKYLLHEAVFLLTVWNFVRKKENVMLTFDDN